MKCLIWQMWVKHFNCKYTKVLENAKIDAFLIAFPQIILFSLAIQYQLLDTDTLDAFKAVWLHMIILHKRMRLHLLSSFSFPLFKKERIGIDSVLSEIGFHSFFLILILLPHRRGGVPWSDQAFSKTFSGPHARQCCLI